MDKELQVILAVKDAVENGAVMHQFGGTHVNNTSIARAAIRAYEKASPAGSSPVENRLRRRTHEIAEEKDKVIGELTRELNRWRKLSDKTKEYICLHVSPDRWEQLSWEARVAATIVYHEHTHRTRGANNAIKRAVQLGKQALQNARDAERYLRNVDERELERLVINGELNSLVAGID